MENNIFTDENLQALLDANKPLCHIERVHSPLIRKIILRHLNEHIFLEIVKYNKKLLRDVKFTIDEYVYYDDQDSPIILEILPKAGVYGTFINLMKKDKDYVKVYFDNSVFESKTNFITKKMGVKKIKIVITRHFKDFKYLFARTEVPEYMRFLKFDRTNITDISKMFMGCCNLKYVDLRKFRTDKVTSIACMFYDCHLLEYADLSNFNINELEDASGLFYNCYALKTVKLFKLGFGKLKTIYCMFSYCYHLNTLIIKDMKPNYKLNNRHVFYGCDLCLIEKFIKTFAKEFSPRYFKWFYIWKNEKIGI